MMQRMPIGQEVVDYIEKRSCSEGGYCFYRLEEPNPHDTYFALAALDLLQVTGGSEHTICYLHSIQLSDGGYDSLNQAFFVLSSLRILGSQPLRNPTNGVQTFSERLLDLVLRPADASGPFFHALHRLTSLRDILRMKWGDSERTTILRAIQNLQYHNGGFGIESASLPDTYLVARILRHLGMPVPVDAMASFLRACEHPVFGFTGKSGSSLFFLEYLHAGLALCMELARIPTFSTACLNALLRCQTNTGGFARAHLAIATMDNTYRAVHGLSILKTLGAL